MSKELKPCPFCGEDNPIKQKDRKVYIITTCHSCMMAGVSGTKKRETGTKRPA